MTRSNHNQGNFQYYAARELHRMLDTNIHSHFLFCFEWKSYHCYVVRILVLLAVIARSMSKWQLIVESFLHVLVFLRQFIRVMKKINYTTDYSPFNCLVIIVRKEYLCG